MARVLLENISKRFGRVQALHALNLEIRSGEFLALLGPSGCGKTTTLRILAGLETPTTGEIYFDDRRVTPLPPAERNIAMVFQLNALYPYMTVRENIGFPLRARGIGRAEIHKRITAIAELLGIAPLLDLPASHVHPADGQRVAIAKAIVSEPDLFLLDEPFSHLDAPTRARMRAELKHLHETLGRTMVFVTHDQAEALALSDRVAVMRQGELVQLGTPEEIFHRPVDRYVAQFVGTPPINLLSVVLQEEAGCLWAAVGTTRWVLPPSLRRTRLPQRVELAIRPRYLRVRREENYPQENPFWLPGRVEVVEPMGREILLHIQVGDDSEIRAVVSYGRPFAEGELVRLGMPPEHLLLFDPESGQALNQD